MFIKLLLLCAVGVLIPTCNCLYTFSVHKPAANYIEENDIEEIYPRASTERDLIDIRPEEAIDNEIPDVDDKFLKNDVEDNIVEVDLYPEQSWKKDTELDEPDSDEEHFWPIFKASTEEPVDKDVDDWYIHNPATTEETLDTSSEGNVNHFWPIYKATTEETPSVYNPATDKSISTEENVETSSESDINILTDESTNFNDDSIFMFKFSFGTDPLFGNGEDDDKSNDDSSGNFFHISFGDVDEQEKEEKPDVTIVLPEEPIIDEDQVMDYEEILNERVKIMIRIQEVIDELEKMAAAMDDGSNKEDGDISPISTYDYVNRRYTPYKSPYADSEEAPINFNNHGYFRNLHMASTDRPYENPFEGHKWHDAPVFNSYARHYEDLY